MKYKTQEQEINKIFARYTKAMHMEKLRRDGYYNLLEEDEGEFTELKKFKKRVELTVAVMRPITKMFIKNSFLEKKDDCWWCNIYSRSTYYRYRRDAIEEFLYYFKV